MWRGLLNWFRWGSAGSRFPSPIGVATLTIAAANRTVTIVDADRTVTAARADRTVTFEES